MKEPASNSGPTDFLSRAASELMTATVVSISETAPLREAIAMLVDRGFSGAPVINEAGRPVGAVSMTDIVVRNRNSDARAKLGSEYFRQSDLTDNAGYQFEELTATVPDRTIVRDVMTPIVFAVRPQVPAKEVIEEMLRLHVHRLFVVGEDGVLVGVIAMSDILRRLLD